MATRPPSGFDYPPDEELDTTRGPRTGPDLGGDFLDLIVARDYPCDRHVHEQRPA